MRQIDRWIEEDIEQNVKFSAEKRQKDAVEDSDREVGRDKRSRQVDMDNEEKRKRKPIKQEVNMRQKIAIRQWREIRRYMIANKNRTRETRRYYRKKKQMDRYR